MLLARMPFRDYQSSDRKELLQKLLDIEIREAQRFAAIHWKDEFLGMPFFECAAKDSGKVEKASAVHYRHKEDCYSAGMPNPPNFHDVRRFGINEAGKSKVINLLLLLMEDAKIKSTRSPPACDLVVIRRLECSVGTINPGKRSMALPISFGSKNEKTSSRLASS